MKSVGKGVENEPLHTQTPQSPRRSCRSCLNSSLDLVRNTRIDYKWQHDGGKTVRGPSIVLMAWELFQIASEVRFDDAQINMAYNRKAHARHAMCKVFSHRLTICLIAFGGYDEIVSLLTVWFFHLSDAWSHGRAKIQEVIDILLLQLACYTSGLWKEAVSHGKVHLRSHEDRSLWPAGRVELLFRVR